MVQPEDAGAKLSVFLRRRGLSASLVKCLKYRPEGLRVNGVRAYTNLRLQAGDRVQATYHEQEQYSVPPQNIPLTIVYESAHTMVVEKPPGLVVHPTRSHSDGTLANAFAFEMEKRGMPGIFRPVGRLDADTSGLMLLALDPYAAPLLAASLQKSYLALVQGVPPAQGVVDAPLAPRPDSVIAQWVQEDGKPSCTRFERLAAGQRAALMRLVLETGRTHQIRVHMAHIGHPLLGDTLYNGPLDAIQRHALHCAQIGFDDPERGAVQLHSPPPADFRQAAALHGLRYVD